MFSKLTLGAVALSVGLFLSTQSDAATVVVDDAAFGTETVLRDTTNNQDFLRLDLTMGYGYNNILTELGSGGDFEGWGIASTLNMLALGASYGITHGTTNVAQIALAEQLRDWFCPTGTCVNFSSTHTYARALVSDSTATAGSQDAFSIGRRFNVTPNEADLRISGFGSPNSLSEEVWLTRVAVAPVPLPASALLLLSGMLGLGAWSRRKSA